MNSLVGTPYKYGGKDRDGIDCSGTITFVLNQMGYNVPAVNAQTMASGKVDYITINNNPDISKDENTGMLNFYKLGESEKINHVNVGIGLTGTPTILTVALPQIVDATTGDTLNKRDGAIGQYYMPGTNRVNQTFAPFSTNPASALVSQGTIN